MRSDESSRIVQIVIFLRMRFFSSATDIRQILQFEGVCRWQITLLDAAVCGCMGR